MVQNTIKNRHFQITFEDGQGLGNQLWLYAALRGISNYHNASFFVNEYEKFKGKNFLKLEQGVFNTDSKIDFFNEKLFHDIDLNTISCSFDESIKTIKKNYNLKGYFQSEKYFFGKHNMLSNWIHPNDNIKNLSREFNSFIVLNIRGGEYKYHKELLLPKSYWYNSVKVLTQKYDSPKFILVTDDHDYAKWLFPKFSVISESIEECYAALHGAKAISLSNSSFGYFPIKTRLDKPFVIAPLYWARYENKFKRWASPANLYKEWNYLDKDGYLHNYQELIKNFNSQLKYFENMHKTNIDEINKLIVNKYFFVPNFLKKILKIFLHKINPIKY